MREDLFFFVREDLVFSEGRAMLSFMVHVDGNMLYAAVVSL